MVAATSFLFDDGDEDGNDDGLGLFIFDPLFPPTSLVPPASVVIFRYSGLRLAFSEAADVFVFDEVSLMEEEAEDAGDDEDDGMLVFPWPLKLL